MIENVIIKISDEEYYDDTQLLVRSFFKGVNIIRESTGGDSSEHINIKKLLSEEFEVSEKETFFLDSLSSEERECEYAALVINADVYMPCEHLNETDRGALHDIYKRKLYEALVGFAGRTLPWGFLTGVRPAKRAMEIIKKDVFYSDEPTVISQFSKKYMTSEKKARLSYNVAKNEMSVLLRNGISFDNDKYQGFSIYAGIPFCPTTCLYCSFASLPISVCDETFINDYVEALCNEINRSSDIYMENIMKRGCGKDGLSPSSVYIGGGTPTALSAELLGKIIDCISRFFSIDSNAEFCVESGRPDSITEEKLLMLKEKGVNRISVNPQSMNQKTLDLIGRSHTPEDVYKSFELARKIGFDNINTDIILGLPGEGKEELRKTVEALEKLGPDSITVHSLALKRASKLNIDSAEYKHIRSENSEEMIDMTADLAERLCMRPYYMYRQQNMSGNLENTGYAREGKESLYNIVIMEEVQDILAFGAGASSKLMMGNNRFERAVNVKDVRNYISRVDEMCSRKEKLLNNIE